MSHAMTATVARPASVMCLVIPADPAEPLRVESVRESPNGGFAHVLGGPVEVLDLIHPDATLHQHREFTNRQEDSAPSALDDPEGAKREGEEWPINDRADFLAAIHTPDPVLGDDGLRGAALLLGPVGADGSYTSVPAEMIRLLLGTPVYGLDVITTLAPGQWLPAAKTFTDWHAAYRGALKLFFHPTIERVRVVPSETGLVGTCPERARDRLAEYGLPAPDLRQLVHFPSLEQLAGHVKTAPWEPGTAARFGNFCLIKVDDAQNIWLAVHGSAVYELAGLTGGGFADNVVDVLTAVMALPTQEVHTH